MTGSASETVTIAQAMQMALAHHQAGRLPEAEAIYRQILMAEPRQPEALHFLGLIAKQVGQHEIAVELIDQALANNPEYAEAHSSLGNALQAQGKLDEAVASYRKALEINPDYVAAHNNLGGALTDQGKLEEAVASLQQALSIRPDHAAAHYNLGKAYQKQGALDEAVASYGKALALNPDYADTHNNLGNALKELGSLDEAVESLRSAIRIRPDYVEAYNNLGNAFKEQGKLDEAIVCYRQALVLKPDYADVLSNLGAILSDQGMMDEAITHFHQALALRPDFAESRYNLGIALQAQGKFEAAAENYRQALALKPDYAEAHNNLVSVLGFQGKLNAAIDCCLKALEQKPDYAKIHSSLIFLRDMSPGITVSAMQQERQRWGKIHAVRLLTHQQGHPNSPEPERRLRIGYVSADLRNHSAAKVFGAMLTRFDSSRFEVFAYSNSRKADSYTRLFQQHVSCWRDIAGLSDDAVAELIRRDQIDILVDLSGHSADNRLLVFARKPAPIQVTAWGYIGGTGMDAMDVFFADPVVVPPEEKPLYTEQVRYLPNIVCTFFPYPFPPVNALPAQSTNGITFGSFNRLVKISDEAYRVWTQVLLNNPESRIILKTDGLDDPSTKDEVAAHFINAGISPERLVMLGSTSWDEHMAAFNQVDVSLDPFPHGGGVTALEGLMMGVPVITLRCPTLVGRLSASILAALGLTDWIAETPEEYIEIAKRKARDVAALAELRQQLRNRLSASIMGDADAYVRAVEHEYQQLWREWCGRQAGICVDALIETEPTSQETQRLVDLFSQGRYAEIEPLSLAMTMRFPFYGFGWEVLGVVFKQMGRIEDALVSMQRAAVLSPNNAVAHSNLGLTLNDFGRLEEAEASFRRALAVNPDFAEAHNNLGNTLKGLDRLDEAEASYRRALQIKPGYAEARNNLGTVLLDLGRVESAVTCFRDALEIKPDFAEAHHNLGHALLQLCKHQEALESLRQALALKPDFAEAHGNLMFAQDMAVGVTVSEMQEERRRWGERHAAPLPRSEAHPNLPDPERRLRIGYVSADLRNHSAAKVFGAMLTRFDSTQYEVFAYSNSRKADSYTEWFQQSVSCWRDIAGISDETVAAQIRQDRIDILVDLSGHSAGNRLLVFARKPAPIQITAWGYIGGTGMEAMDIFFADPVIVPPEEKTLYSEQVRYLPNVVSYCCQASPPPVNTLPSLRGKGITFGSFNRLVKSSEETYRTWAQVLQAHPNSRIILKTVGLDDPSTRDRVTGHFAAAGITPERLILLGGTTWQEHMEAFSQVDISLDPFPHGGGVTTLEGLMMGVPVITLRCPTLVGRLSSSILTTLELTDWIAESPEEYIEIAKRKARDVAGLADLRRQLRDRVSRSIIGDAEAYAKAVEQEYRQLWREWCARQDTVIPVGS